MFLLVFSKAKCGFPFTRACVAGLSLQILGVGMFALAGCGRENPVKPENLIAASRSNRIPVPAFRRKSRAAPGRPSYPSFAPSEPNHHSQLLFSPATYRDAAAGSETAGCGGALEPTTSNLGKRMPTHNPFSGNGL